MLLRFTSDYSLIINGRSTRVFLQLALDDGRPCSSDRSCAAHRDASVRLGIVISQSFGLDRMLCGLVIKNKASAGIIPQRKKEGVEYPPLDNPLWGE